MREVKGNLQKCSVCGEFKTFDLFYKRKDSKYGIEGLCKVCKNDRKNGRRESLNKVVCDLTNSTQVCRVCKVSKKFDEFVKDKSRKNGITTLCKACKREAYVNKPYIRENKREIDLINSTQKCAVCGKTKSFDLFTVNKSKLNNLDNVCKECNSTRTREYYKKFPKKKKEADNKYGITHKKEISNNKKNYYILNEEYIKEDRKEYYIENTEEIKKRVANYSKTPRGRAVKLQSRHLRRAKMKEVETDISKEYLIELRSSTIVCEICGTKLVNEISDSQYNLDHIIPINVGGKHMKDNVRYICRKCNLKRPKDGSDLIM